MNEPTLGAPLGRSIQLSHSGVEARIIPDHIIGGWHLDIGGIIQSHVDLADPLTVRYDYLRRMANIMEMSWPTAAPLDVLHLGAGALTMARYVQASRPGSHQTVIELERELISLVVGKLPLPVGTVLTPIVGDAREQTRALAGQLFDVIIMDVYTGDDVPAHLTGTQFYTELLSLLHDDGALLINIGDEIGLEFFAREAQAFGVAADEAGLSGAWSLGNSAMLEQLHYGNVVLAAGGALSAEHMAAIRQPLLASGPHPAAVLDPVQTAALAARIRG